MGVRDCDYGRTMGTGMGVLRVQIQAYVHMGIDINIFMRCTICLYHVCNAYIQCVCMYYWHVMWVV